MSSLTLLKERLLRILYKLLNLLRRREERMLRKIFNNLLKVLTKGLIKKFLKCYHPCQKIQRIVKVEKDQQSAGV